MLPDLQAILETLIGEGVAGVATYENLLPNSMVPDLFGHPVRVMSLQDLIRAKEAFGRPKDASALEILRETLRLQDENTGENAGS